MLVDFFFALKKAEIPVSITELLDLLGALEKHLAFASLDEFYELSRLLLVKNEKYYDKFDQVFGAYFSGVEQIKLDENDFSIPKDWLIQQLKRVFSPEELTKIKAQGDLEELMRLFKQRLAEQKERHEGGNKWIGTGGTSPFGAFGYNPQGFRIDQFESRHRRAIKVWEKRQFRDLDEDTELNTRNFQIALRRLRVLAKDQMNETLDLFETIKATANNAGYLELKNTYEKHNTVKVLLFFDIGGSMDDYVDISKQLFQAVRHEFKNMEIFYFHNCLYESVWKNNARRYTDKISTMDLIRTFGEDYKVIFVGDATMSLFEIREPGGSVEHYNQETGAFWLTTLKSHFKHVCWLNPVDRTYWNTPSIQMIRELVDDKMFPLTTEGIMSAMKSML